MKIVSLITCLFPLISWSQSDSAYKGILYTKGLNWQQIKEKASKENKFIFLDCYTTWCGPCKRMEKETFPNWRVGEAVNPFYISVKVQMDSTVTDANDVRQWYADADNINRVHGVAGYPTFLFFSPDAKLVHRGSGFKNIKDFIDLVNLAKDPLRQKFYNLYLHYKNNKTDTHHLRDLAIYTADLIKDKSTAQEMARDYKKKVLDNKSTNVLLAKENITFALKFSGVFSIRDKYFQIFNKHPALIDSIAGYRIAARKVNDWIVQSELDKPLLENGKGVLKYPDWKSHEQCIKKKYSTVDAARIVLDYKVNYYRWKYLNWRLWASCRDELIQKYMPTDTEAKIRFASTELNTLGAWNAFLFCSDSLVLSKALNWAEQSCAIDPSNVQYQDTRASLLYKLGRVAEAMVIEEAAVVHRYADQGIKDRYMKMQQGLSTWLDAKFDRQ
ncbi:DUF255 domain-containing protein [Chitinophaga sp. S165]|uniref:thioredoxin family protein n=1 Tax=Chitinophaga sp. S165 TaxID=2135462 RepID=UPI000D71303F|nr:DUF255 domain-containing protein [Chitinophaga sp. S165]PWV47093.1 uncharacterized protein DUF255 [Chitinophaga sp. S165]